MAVFSIAIAEQISRSGIPRKGFDDLLASPGCRWGIGDVEVNNEASSVGQYDTGVENPKRRRGHSEEINRGHVAHMVAQEGFPGLGWRFSVANHVFRDGCWGHLNLQHEQLSVDSRGSPERIFTGHSSDQIPDLSGDLRTAPVPPPALQSPEELETPPMPGNYRFWLDDNEHLGPVSPYLGEEDPEQSIGFRQSGAFHRSTEDGKLLPECQVFQGQSSLGSQC